MRLASILLFAMSVGPAVATAAGDEPPMRFPGAEWEVVSPQAEGLDPAKLEAAVEYLEANSGGDGVHELMVVRRGRVVWQGDNADKVHGVWSCTKSFTSTALGLLVEDGECTLDTQVADIVPELRGRYPAVTLRHLATMTSGYRAAGDAEAKGGYLHGPSATPFVPAEPLFSPGEKYAYWDSAMNLLGLALTRVAGEPLEDLVQRRVMDPIGVAPSAWAWGTRPAPDGTPVNSGSGNGGGHIRIAAGDLARFGHLFLNRGSWEGEQLVSRDWIAQATAAQVPASLPEGFPPSNIPGAGCYGFNWWINGVKPDGARKWPGAPAGTFAALGHNNNRLWVIPDWQMVVVRLGLDEAERKIDDAVASEFLKRMGESIADVGEAAVSAAFDDPLQPFFAPPPEFAEDFGNYRSPLVFDDGRPVRTAEEWPRRREEILRKWHSMLGEWPPVNERPTVEYVEQVREPGYVRHTVKLDLAPGFPPKGYLLVPDATTAGAVERRPAVLVVYYEPETAAGLKGEDRDFARQLAKRGFVTLSIGMDASLYHPSREAAELQPLSALAWAAANAFHVLATRDDVDPERVGIVGHSYGSKWAMFASCFYDRFACAAWSDGGIVFDETRPNVNYWEPWYLGYEGPRFRERGVPSDTNPRTGAYRKLIEQGWDLHELHALMAPRPFLVSGGSEDPPERWRALNHAVAVNRLLGYENRVAMTNRPGHAPTPESNEQICLFFERFLKPPGPEGQQKSP